MSIKAGMLFFLLLLCGCNRVYVYQDSSYPQEESHGIRKYYKLGQQQTAYIGDALVKWQEMSFKKQKQPPEFILEDNFSIEGQYDKRFPLTFLSNSVNLSGKKGDRFRYAGTTNIGSVKYTVLAGLEDYNLLVNEEGNLNRNILLDVALDHKYCSKTSELQNKHIHFSKKEGSGSVAEGEPGISSQLLFGGLNDVTLNVTYREFTSGDLARPAFYQNLVYKTTADSIRYKGFKIKVHSVTNEMITFTILEDGLPENDGKSVEK